MPGRLLPRLLPPALFLLVGTTWLFQNPPGPIPSNLVEKSGVIHPAAKSPGSDQKHQEMFKVIPHPKQRQLHLAAIGKAAPPTDSEWVNQTLTTFYKNRTSIYLYSAYLVSESFLSDEKNPQDDRESRQVRVLGLAPHKIKAPMVCIGEDKHGARVELRLDLKQNKEHWNLPYSSYFFNCALRGTFLPVQVP